MTAALSLYTPGDLPDEITVPDIVALYLACLEKRVAADDFSAENLGNIRRDLNRFALAYPLRISECRQADLIAWFDKNSQWRSAHTKKGGMSRIVGCFNWAADSERGDLIDKSPFKSIRAISKLPYIPRRPAKHEEYRALMRNGCIEFRRALFFLFETGTRPCEMRELIWDYVRLDEDAPHLCYARHKTYRQVRKEKLVGLNEKVVRLLRYLHRRRNRKEPHVFLNTDGNWWQQRSFSKHLGEVATRAGLGEGTVKKVSAGCLRTTLACDGIKKGFTNRQVADMLGHESTWMVDHVYGAATRQETEHLGKMAAEMAKRRNDPGK